MTTSTQIKLSPAMETALKGATIGFSPNFGVYTGIVPEGTKSQTTKGLASRGLSDESGILTTDGVEAARQLGVELPPWQAPGNDVSAAQIEQEIAEGIITPHTDRVVPMVTLVDEPLADWERELLHTNMWEPKTGIDTNDEQTANYVAATTLTPVQQEAVDQLADLLDKPVTVPNREDKRKMKFSLRGAASRLFQRNKQRRISKYGTTKYGEVTS
jgi:hypothetical protein